MNKSRWIFGTTSLGAILLFGFGNVALQASEAIKKQTSKPNKIVQEECGACHMVYPAKLLPKKSWKKIMANLENHFEENAEVDVDTNFIIRNYL
jgi:homoserine dehydrogenase